jgi:Flp pilus assembly protein TadD
MIVHHVAMRLLLLTLLLAANTFAALPLPNEKEKWLKLTAAEFRIYSNASARETEEIATNLLRMREAIGKVTRLEVRSRLPMYVFVFRNERAFAPYRDAVSDRRNATVDGLFLSTGRANFVLLQGDAGRVDRVVYHELTHYFVNNTVSGLPLWFEEGIAEYYSTFQSSGEKVSIGFPIDDHVHWLRDGNTMPLAQLFAVDVKSPDYSEGRRQGIFYAQSWALTHYLLRHPERRDQLPFFLDLLRDGKPTDVAFQSAFQVSYADVEKELRNYLRNSRWTYTSYALDELQIPPVEAPMPAERDDVLFALGNLAGHGPDAMLDDAVKFLDEATRLNAKHAEAHAALGLVHERRRDRAAATAAYEKAVALGSLDPTVYINYGSALVERKDDATKNLARARQLFERAAELDPASPRAWAGIGLTYVGDPGDFAPGIAALEKSLSLAAGQDDAAINLIQLYARAGRRAEAQRVFDTHVARSLDPDVVRHGREAVLLADLKAAEDLMRGGNRVEALNTLRTLLAATTNPELQAHVRNILATEEDNAERQRQAEMIELAFTKARDRKFTEALQIVDALLPQIADDDIKAEVQKLRTELVKATRKR